MASRRSPASYIILKIAAAAAATAVARLEKQPEKLGGNPSVGSLLQSERLGYTEPSHAPWASVVDRSTCL